MINDYAGKVCNFEKVLLSRLSFFGKFSMNSFSLKELRDTFLYSVRMDIVNNDLGGVIESVEFVFPATPWQHFKQAYFPKFFLRYFPVKTKVEVKKININGKVLFPKWDKVLPEEMGYMYVAVIRDE